MHGKPYEWPLSLSPGKDATAAFAGVGHSDDALQMREGNYLIGIIDGYDFGEAGKPVAPPPKPVVAAAAPPPAE